MFTSIDLKSEFYQIPMHPDSVEKTELFTPDGQWELLHMPFGLANAPPVFQAMIKRVLKDLAYVYVDDVLISSMNLNEAFTQLEKVLAAFRVNKLTLNLQKCSFFQRKINYLGREIFKEGVRPGREKVKAVLRTPDPQNMKQIRQFLGLAGYFRRFIRDFVRKAYSLIKLLSKDACWSWGPLESAAVEEIKRILADRPVLAIYDPKLETEVHGRKRDRFE